MLDYKKHGFKKFILGYIIIIVLTIIVSICSVIIFIGVIAPRFKGMTSVFIFSIIPLLYGGVYVFILFKSRKIYDKIPEKDKFKFDLSKQILMYISIMLILFFLFLISLRIPFEKQGINDVPLSLIIQPYLANDTLNIYDENVLYGVNNIYEKYNISIQINNPINLNFSFNNSDKKLIFTQDCIYINSLYNLINNSGKEVKLIMINSNNSIDGMAHFCGKGDLIIMSINNSISPEWVLAHELGHVLSARMECWKYNLMKEYSRACYNGANWFVHDYIRDLKPSYLKQEQVDAIVQSVRTRFL